MFHSLFSSKNQVSNELCSSPLSLDITEFDLGVKKVLTDDDDTSWYADQVIDDENIIHIVWESRVDYDGAGPMDDSDFDIFYMMENISNGIWSLTQIVSLESSSDSTYPALAVGNNGNIHVVWTERIAGIPYIAYKVWKATDQIWSPMEIISTNPSLFPAIDIDPNGNIFVVWQDFGQVEIRCRVWNSTLEVWDSIQVISTESTSNNRDPDLSVDGNGNVYVVWADKTDYIGSGVDYDIFCKLWNASAKLWTTTEVVSTESSLEALQPAIAVDSDGDVHVVWMDRTNFNNSGTDEDVHYKSWNFTSRNWGLTQIISIESTDAASTPSIATDDMGNVHIAWEDQTNYFGGAGVDFDIYYRVWNKIIDELSVLQILTPECTSSSIYSKISVDLSGNAHIVWSDSSDYKGSGTDFDIFYNQIVLNNSPPVISGPTDCIYSMPLKSIKWVIVDGTLGNNPSYIIMQNGTITSNGTLVSNESIIIDLDRYPFGVHNYTIIVDDGFGVIVKDEVLITINYIVDPMEVVSQESTDNSFYPQMVVDERWNCFITWEDSTNYSGAGTDSDIFYKVWNATKRDWGLIELISTESTADSRYPAIAIDEMSNIHITWHDFTNYSGAGTDSDIFYKVWNATNHAWGLTQLISTESTADSGCPAIAIDKMSNVHITWWDFTNYSGAGTDRDIFYKVWNSTTHIWGLTQLISTECDADSDRPTIVVDSFDNRHVLWDDNTNYSGAETDRDIFYKVWNATTHAWGLTEIISIESTEPSFNPKALIERNGNLNIFWREAYDYGGFGTDYDIVHKIWNASSNSWGLVKIVSEESSSWSGSPQICMDRFGDIHVVWMDNMDIGDSDYGEEMFDRPDIFYKKWDSKSNDWVSIQLISIDSNWEAEYPTVGVDPDGNAYVAWQDWTEHNATGMDTDIFLVRLIRNNTIPIVQYQADEKFEVGSKGHSIVWIIEDRTVSSLTYTVFRNGNQVKSGVFEWRGNFTINTDELSNGVWNYTLVVDDGLGTVISDEIFVTVSLPSPSNIPLMIALIVLCVVFGIIGIYTTYRVIQGRKPPINVFISHAVADYEKKQVKEISKNLQSRSTVNKAYVCEADIKANIDEWMGETIPLCQVLIFIATERSLNSRDCKREIELARKFGLFIIPIIDNGIDWSNLEKLKIQREFGFKLTTITFADLLVELSNYIDRLKTDFDKLQAKLKKASMFMKSKLEKDLELGENIIKKIINLLIKKGAISGIWTINEKYLLLEKEVLHRVKAYTGERTDVNLQELIDAIEVSNESKAHFKDIIGKTVMKTSKTKKKGEISLDLKVKKK